MIDGAVTAEFVTGEMMDTVLATLPPDSPPAAPPLNGHAGPVSAGVIDRAGKYTDALPPGIAGENGSKTTFAAACALVLGFDLSPEAAFPILAERFNPRCQPPWSDSELRHKLEDANKKPGPRGKLLEKSSKTKRERKRRQPAQSSGDTAVDGIHYSDVGNGSRYASDHAADVRYCHPWEKWLEFVGTHWAADETGGAHRRAKATIRRMYADAIAMDDRVERAALLEHALESENMARLNAMLKAAQSEPGIPALPAQLDTDILLFNTASGTINLAEGTLREHRREDLITRVSPVKYYAEQGDDCPVFQSFLDTILAGRPELIGFVQRLLGYCLTGEVAEQILPIFYGVGANGKSTLLNLMLCIMGEYAMKCAPDLLMVKHGNAHPTERADLFGRRLIVANETEDGQQLAESLTKDLTGGDRVRARRMREDFWEFNPTHKIILATNHAPTIRGQDHAIWRRIRLVPFDVVIPDDQQDKQLPEKLKAEAPAILRWLVQGCLDWRRHGLGCPDEVKMATANYRATQDQLAAFIEACCVVESHACAPAGELFDAYREFTGDKAITQTKFGLLLADRKFHRDRFSAGKHKGRIGWWGLGLLSASE